MVADQSSNPAGSAGSSIPARFAAVCAASPGASAVRAADGTLTYAELDDRARRIADRLRAAGLRPEERVAVLLDRSVNLPAALLGILLAGGAYLALDPGDPAVRHAALLTDADVRYVITEAGHAGQVGASARSILIGPGHTGDITTEGATAGPVERVDDADTLAYVAYTSGSTGTPKGAAIPHRAVLRLVVGCDYLDVGPSDAFAQLAPVAFDASAFEIWGALLNGATLVLAPPRQLTPHEVVAMLRDEGVTVCWLTSGLFHQVVEAGIAAVPRLRYLLAGGDVLAPADVNRAAAALNGGLVLNGYGPTENTTFTCCQPIREPVTEGSVPIGRPIRGTTAYVLDDDLRQVPDGYVGILHAAGAGLARGYLDRPGMTAQRFRPNPYSDEPGARMYDTGDLVRRRPGGTFEFIGRRDNQVKLRGFRVEPEEVEAALAALDGISAAAVVAQVAGGERRLAAYYTSDVPLRSTDLRGSLAQRLPLYMVPATFARLAALPLTPSGKLDRMALAERVGCERPDVSATYRAPTDPIERWLAERWQEVMDIESIGIDDDFFELGGHSLLATRITGEIAARYQILITARTFYENATVAELAAAIDARLPGEEGGVILR